MTSKANDVPVTWINGAEINDAFGDEFAKKLQELRARHREEFDALMIEAANLYPYAQEGKQTVVFKGTRVPGSLGVKFLDPEVAKEQTKPRAKGASLEAKMAALGAVLVKKGQTMKDAGVTPTPVVSGKQGKRA